MTNKKDLIDKIARLETINDQLASEIRFLDKITRELGFSDGIKTLKSAAMELLEIEKQKEEFEFPEEE